MSDRIKVLVNGAKGKMGSEVVRAVKAEADLELAGECDLGDDLAQAIYKSHAQVVVDFTHPDAGVQNTATILECGARPVIGTTGFQPKDINNLDQIAHLKGLGGIVAPNFAIGALLMMRFAAEAVRYMPQAEIIEIHHDQKADAPSGTAIKTAEAMTAVSEAPRGIEEKILLAGARGATSGGYHVHSVRLPGFVAHQEVIFGAPGQSLTIRHDTTSRTCFMPGVILAVRKVLELKGIVYGLDKVLFEN